MNILALHLLPKLIYVSSFMARWGRTFFPKFREKVKKQKAILVDLVNRVDESSIKEYLVERDKLNEMLLHEEVYSKYRAMVIWLTEGDENTKFFHASASARKKTNHIAYLETTTGVRVEDHDGMCNVVKDYFFQVFMDPGEESLNQQNHYATSTRTVTNAQNMELIKEASFEEFSLVVKQMHPDNASGPDGLNPALFQSFWSVMGREVFECCKSWLRENKFPTDLNNTNVV